LIALKSGGDVARASLAQATLLRSPEIRMGTSDLAGESDGFGDRRTNVGLRWSPPRPGELGLKSNIARSHVRESSFNLAAAEQRLAAEVRLLYATVALLGEQIRIANRVAGIRADIFETVKTQVQVGTKSILDRSLAELSLAEARAIADRYRAEQRLQKSRFAAKLDAPLSYDPVLEIERDPLGFAVSDLEPRKLIATALETRMELKAASARCSRAELEVKTARRERFPWISFVQVDERLGRVNQPGTWNVHAGVELPVFHWRNQAVQKVSAELDQCTLQQASLKASVVGEVEELVLRIESGHQDLQHYREVVVPLSEEDVEVSRAALKEGRVDAVELLLAQERQLKAQHVYVTRLMDVRALEIGLDQALGIANP
jgi:outer membrane protein TolC